MMELVWTVRNIFARMWGWFCSLTLVGQIIVVLGLAVVGLVGRSLRRGRR